MRNALVAVVIVTAALLGGCGGAPTMAKGTPERPCVARVVDVDTIRVHFGGDREEAVRLIGIDTPETHGQGGLRECFGAEATEHTKRLLPDGTAVRLERDAELRDRYDRLLAYVYRESDDLFVNLALVRDGFAATATFPPNVAHRDEFAAAAAEARENDLGLWSRCGGADTALDSLVDLPP